MNLNLRYGVHKTLSLELSDEQLVAHCDAPRGRPLDDVAQAVDRALAEPVEYPPLARAVLPGDKVTLVLTEIVPQAATIVARTVEALTAAGVEPADITLLRGRDDAVADADFTRAAGIPASIVHERHDPADRGALGYVAASKSGDAIYVNRAIHEADLTITIGCQRLATSFGLHGVFVGVFPAFSDTSSQNRYRSPAALEPRQRERLEQQANEAGWLMGSPFVVQVVPGADDNLLHVLAGEPRAVERAGNLWCDDAWSYETSQRAELVITTITGASQQTWDNVARALAAASHVVNDDGAIAVCTDLDEPPGAALQRIAGADDPAQALHRIGKYRPADTLVAAEIVRALAQGKVYLLSRLADDVVENLGFLPVEGQQLSRLASRYGSCVVLENAQYAVALPSNEA